MSGTTVDARGQLCPKPLIMTKKVLNELASGEDMTIVIDNETSKDNVYRFLQDNGADVTCTEADGVFTIRVKKATDEMPKPDVQDGRASVVAKPHVIAIKNDKMGFGSDELGQILIHAFINTIQETSPLPGTIVFYNNGVHLAVEGSPVIDALEELESRGVEILVCGTCLDYYGKKELVRVGRVSNLYDILQALTTAGHVIVP
jgi:selenium metabolism protein YedF